MVLAELISDAIIWSSLAAIQASKEHAKEVDLQHFEWAKASLVSNDRRYGIIYFASQGSDYHGSRTEKSIH